MANRRDELPRTWFRSNRVFRSNGEWFIHTREGIAVGPYADKFAAEVDAEVLKSLLVDADVTTADHVISKFMDSEGRNHLRNSKIVEQFDTDEVAGLLADDEDGFDFDQIRQLS